MGSAVTSSDLAIFGRVALAALLGFLIGFEREVRGKPAGERTFALVAIGAAAFTGYAVERFPLFGDRVIQGLVAGIGFLGVGMIFRTDQGFIHGLTTAASAWAVAAVGVLSGGGRYVLAAPTTGLILVVLEIGHLPLIRAVEARRHRRTGPPGLDPEA